MAVNPIPAVAGHTADHRYSLRDVVAAYGCDAVRTRITALHAAGCHRAARVIERELHQLNISQPRPGLC
ncbi:hypothetical protein NDR87_34225 [Nocardia sp. CDC159]|uniref:Uncharacterized protein n=1 Tax=Nocardia pulmonis TaxID=2951408 RepID=A0A9X2IZW7_9NOCA|nr:MULTISPECIES: hypothetical protein [Nocardia]MCM6778552.1 hypothetical protein [Nocardia pulmonis]MCM6791441.1 hypothetical protein [Nocardia sp. CDC159]